MKKRNAARSRLERARGAWETDLRLSYVRVGA
jgi:hypothetical protein